MPCKDTCFSSNILYFDAKCELFVYILTHNFLFDALKRKFRKLIIIIMRNCPKQFIHLFKINNRIEKPTDFQLKKRSSVG